MRRRSLNRRIQLHLQKYKHIVDATFQNVTGSALQNATLIQGADNPTIGSPILVQTRARVKAIFIDISWVTAANNAGGIFHFDGMIWFNPQLTFTTPDPSTVGSQNLKNYVIKQFHASILSNTSVISAPHRFIGVIKIPPKYQRFMLGDGLVFTWKTSAGVSVDQCKVKCIYKEIRG